jgi:SAM-dependent methyltransferase
MIEPIDKNFWEEIHQVNEPWWLTGTQFNKLLEYHSFVEDNIKGKTVLEIGVGLGTCTAGLSNLSEKLYCCDISEIALNRVKTISAQQFLTKDLKSVPAVDIAFCHLVFQHCTDDEIKRIINDINLKDDAIFSFQFSSLKDNIITTSIQELINKGSHFFRSVDIIKKLIDQTNKEFICVSDPIWWGGKNKHEWYIAKVRNKK